MANQNISVNGNNDGIINQGDYNTINVINHYHNTNNQAISIPDIYNASIVSISNSENQIIATGFLVSSRYIITTYQNIATFEQLTVTFALRDPQTSFEAKVIDSNETHNIALLQIDNSEPFTIPLITAQYGEGFVVYGFGTASSEWIEGAYKGKLAGGLHQITTQKPISSGFSGAPVWDIANSGISGVMVDALSMIPISKVLESFSVVDDELRAFHNPYKGLFHFGYEDRANFYGRDEEIAQITKALESTPLYTIMGASGSGKSSLLFAGVVPQLKANHTIITFRPTAEVFKSLAKVFIGSEASTSQGDTKVSLPIITQQIKEIKTLANDLATQTIGLDELIEQYIQMHNIQKLTIIIDQFEELFTLNNSQNIQRFLDHLLSSLNTPATIILSLRSDFLSSISFYPAFNEAINQHPKFILGVMNRANLQKAILLPAHKLGVTFQEGLVDKILDEIEHNKAQLPLLEFALYELWQKMQVRQITHQNLEDMGGITHAISHYANSTYNETKLNKDSIKRIFLKLVNVGSGTEDTRRVANLNEFRKDDKATIKALADKRLIVTTQTSVEVVHEALIREWQIYREWINEYREFLVWEKRLAIDYEIYQSTKKNNDLLKNTKLAVAKEFLKTHNEVISTDYRQFIKRSSRINKRNKMIIAYISMHIISLIIYLSLERMEKSEMEKKIEEIEIQEMMIREIVEKELNGK